MEYKITEQVTARYQRELQRYRAIRIGRWEEMGQDKGLGTSRTLMV